MSFFSFEKNNLYDQQPDLPIAQLDSLIAMAIKPVGDQGPGVAVYLHRRGSAPYQKVSGMANLEYGIPLTEHSVFDLASVAKQFTGMAIAKLVQAEKISLEEDVRTYLPEVPDFGTTITLTHLLQHTSGLRDVGELYGVGNFGREFTAEVALRIVSRQQALNFTPGTEHDYSNTGYVLLAIIVERVTGKSFVDWCQENIFAPLNMTNSFANDAPRRLIPNRATAYYGSNGDFSFNQNNGMSLIGSSAVFASLNDMAKWMSTFSAKENQLFDLMTSPGQLQDGSPVNYNFGLNVSDWEGHTLIEHSGSTPAGFRTFVAHLPEEGLSLVILSNWGDLEPIRDLGRPILSLIFGSPSVPEATDTPEKTVDVPLSVLEQYVGDYLFNQEREVKISLQEKQLLVEIAGMGASTLVPRSATTFFLAPMNSTLVFEMDGPKVSRVAIQEGSDEVGELRLEGESQVFVVPEGSTGDYYSEELGVPGKASISEIL